uniref:CotH kinase family protein n=1 Tax=Roseihalotalea indica TaxID=2867963 RepID=A0AA49JK75_9BACT|nr:CotH kinase family protein [Tunicatimonas sp. TK19036]
MLIKRKKTYRYYFCYGAIVLVSLLGLYGLLLRYKPHAAVSAETRSDSITSVMLKVDAPAVTGLEYTLFGPKNVTEHTQVVGADHHKVTTLPESLLHYPDPVVSHESFPEAVVVALTYPWAPKPDVQQAQYTTVLLDSLSLPVVSLSGPPGYFFGEKGFYSVKDEHSEETSHTIHVELIDTTQASRFSVSAEASVAGYSSKELPMKSLNLRFDTSLPDSLIFGDTLATPLHSVRLRNAGNDFLLAYMRDVVVSKLSQTTEAIGLRYQPVVVFVNGEFWGVQYLREHISEENLRAKHPELQRDQIQLGELNKDKVLVISNGFDYKLGRLTDFMEQKDLHQPQHYDSLSRLIDIPSFIDYIAIQTFVSNSDWPQNNVKGVFLDNKFYFLLYDTDFAFDYPTYYQEEVGNYFHWPDRIHDLNAQTHDYFDSLDHYIPSHVGKIYRMLIEVPAFREQFINRYRELLEGPLSQNRIEHVVEDVHDQIAPLMPQHIARWGYPVSFGDWQNNVQQISQFCAIRRHYIYKQLNRLEKHQSTPPIASGK